MLFLLVGCGTLLPDEDIKIPEDKIEMELMYESTYTDVYKFYDAGNICYVADRGNSIGISCI